MAVFDFSHTKSGVFFNLSTVDDEGWSITPAPAIPITHRTATGFWEQPGGSGAGYYKYTGVNIRYNSAGPTSGVIHKMEAIAPGHPELSYVMSDFSMDIAEAYRVLKTTSLADDKAFALKIFGGPSTFKLGSGADSVAAFNGNDKIYGNAGKDTLNGGGGNDNISGGRHNDVLTGGGGKDKFVFDTALSATNNVDTITDFKPADDTIVLSHSIFGVGAAGTLSAGLFGASAGGNPIDSNDRILYDNATGKLFYDANGGSHSDKVLFAVLSNHAALTNADFVIV
jgi:hypothetical protein